MSPFGFVPLRRREAPPWVRAAGRVASLLLFLSWLVVVAGLLQDRPLLLIAAMVATLVVGLVMLVRRVVHQSPVLDRIIREEIDGPRGGEPR